MDAGRIAEQQYEALCTAHGWPWRRATKREDAQEHWDYLVQRQQPQRVEVKAAKKLKRSDPEPSRRYTWLEHEGVPRIDGQPNTGWLRGRADWIAFQCHSPQGQLGFLLCRRVECLALAERWLQSAKPYSLGPAQLHQLYERRDHRGPRGSTILVELAELARLPESCFLSLSPK